jgi:hypothetical protein
MPYQLSDGSGTGRGLVKGATARIVPVGSKKSWLILEQAGQGTLTDATVRSSAVSPLPLHLTVTLIGWQQVQQAKSNVTLSSIMQRSSRISEAYHRD